MLTLLCANLSAAEDPDTLIFEFKKTIRTHPAVYSYIRRQQILKPVPKNEDYAEVLFPASVWIPSGHLSVLGPHPSIGLQLNGWHNQWLFGMVFDIRMGDAANPYKVFRDGIPTVTKQFLGDYLGYQLGYAFLNSPTSTLYFVAGGGKEEFTPIDGDDNHHIVNLTSINLNAGFGLKHFDKRGGVYGIEIIQNFVHYRNPGATPLDGNAITLRFLIGLIR